MKARSLLLVGLIILCFGVFVVMVQAGPAPSWKTADKLSESEQLARNQAIKDSEERLQSQGSSDSQSPTLVEQLMERLSNGGNLTPSEKQMLDSYIAQLPAVPRNGNSLDNTGTQDGYGYMFVDNVAPDTATYAWIELCGDAGATNGPVGDDVATTGAAIGFTFPFYGVNYTLCNVGTNGIISFGTAISTYTALDAATSVPTSPYIAPFWADQNAASTPNPLGGCNSNGTAPWIRWKTVGTAPDWYFVVEWRRNPEYNLTPPGTLFSYEAILYPNGMVKVQYHETDWAMPSTASRYWACGVDAPGAGNGVRYWYYNYTNTTHYGIIPAAGRVIWFFTPPPLEHNFGSLAITSPAATTYQPNQMVNVTATFKNWGSTTESSPVSYSFNGGATQTRQTGILATNATETDTFATQIQMPLADGSYPLTVWTDLPGDGYRANDTLRMNVQVLNCTRPLPWTENFDGVTAPAVPPCWRVVHGSSGSYTWQTYSSSTYAHSMPISLCMSSGGGYSVKNEWAYSPLFHLLASQSYVLDFWVRGYSTSYSDSLEVKYGATQDSTAMVNTLIARYKDNVNTTYQHQQITFTPPAEGDYTIGFHSTSGTTSAYNPIIDDVMLYVSGTCGAPTVTVSSPTGQDSAALVATVTGGFGGPVQYQWYTGTNCQNGSEIPLANAATYYAHNSGPYSCKAWMVDPLNCASCASGTATVIDCSIPTPLPWSESFDATTGTAFPVCWTVRDYDGDARLWTTTTGTPHSGARTAYCQYSAAGILPNNWLFTPRFALTGGRSYPLHFWARENLTSATYYDSLRVVLTTAPDNNSVVQTLIPTFRLLSATYAEFQVDFTPPGTGNYYISFVYVGSANAGGIYVDDVNVIVFPDGMPLPPTNLQGTVNNTTVTLTWTDPDHDANGNPLTIDSIQVFRTNDQPASQIARVAHGVQTIVLTNESVGRNRYCIRAKYQSYISTSTCISLVVGNPSYNNNFDTDDGGLIATPNIGSPHWAWGPPTNTGGPQPYSSPNVWAIGLNADYAVSQCDDLDVNPGLMVFSPTASIEFYAWYYTELNYDGVNLRASTDGGSTWQVLHSSDRPYDHIMTTGTTNCMAGDSAWAGQSNAWVHITVPIGQFVNQTPMFRFKFGSDASLQYRGFYIDDMIIWGLHAAAPDSATNVTALRVEPIRPDSCIEVRFNAPNAGQYEIWSTTDKNSPWQPGGVWTLETTINAPSGTNAWRDPATLQTFKRYVVSQVTP